MFMFILTKVWIMRCKIPNKVSSLKSSKVMNLAVCARMCYTHLQMSPYFTQVLVAQTLQCFLCSCWLFAKVFRPSRCGLQSNKLVAELSYNIDPAGGIKCVKFLTCTESSTILYTLTSLISRLWQPKCTL